MSNELANILQNSAALVQTGLDEDTLAVAGGGGSQTKRLSIKGGVFRKMSGGKEIGAIEDRHMNVIIVKMAHNASRTFYSQGYKEGEKVSPACWSNDGQAPDAEVKTPQSKTCSTCQFSAKNSGANGTGTACRLSWRMAVVLPNDPSGDVMQLVLPATSCFGKEDNGRWPFRPYIQKLADNNVSASRLVTKMAFDTKSPTPKILFSPVSAVDAGDLEVLARQAKTPAAEAAIKLTVFQVDSTDVEVDNTEFAPTKNATTVAPDVEIVDEPVLREPSAPAPVDKPKDVSNIVSKWAKK
jgi:hypothetical protein